MSDARRKAEEALRIRSHDSDEPDGTRWDNLVRCEDALADLLTETAPPVGQLIEGEPGHESCVGCGRPVRAEPAAAPGKREHMAHLVERYPEPAPAPCCRKCGGKNEDHYIGGCEAAKAEAAFRSAPAPSEAVPALAEAEAREEQLHATNERLALEIVDAEDDRADLAAMYEAAAAERDNLTALLRECNAVCLCGCPNSEHEADACGESCGHDDHECIRVAPAVLEIVQRYRVALRPAPAPAPSEAVCTFGSRREIKDALAEGMVITASDAAPARPPAPSEAEMDSRCGDCPAREGEPCQTETGNRLWDVHPSRRPSTPAGDAVRERPDTARGSAMTHELKTWLAPFAAVLDGRKRFEVRTFDRPFAIGDTLVLNEWDEEHEAATGRSLRMTVTYFVWPGEFGIPADLCVMGIAPVDAPSPPAGDAVREAAERLDSLVNRVWSMTPEEADSAGLPTVAKVLRASRALLAALAAPRREGEDRG